MNTLILRVCLVFLGLSAAMIAAVGQEAEPEYPPGVRNYVSDPPEGVEVPALPVEEQPSADTPPPVEPVAPADAADAVTPEPPAIAPTPVPTPVPRPPLRPAQRPMQTGPEEEPNPFRPMSGETQTEPVNFNFENADLDDVVKAIGAMTGKNFIIDPQLTGMKVTVITHSPIPPEQAFELLQAVLSTYGYIMTPTLDQNMYKIRLMTEEQEDRDVVIGLTPPEGAETFYNYIVQVEYADATELSSILEPLKSKAGRVDVYGPTNTLIISDNAQGIKNILAFLSVVDQPGHNTIIEIFTLEYARAEVLALQIQDVLAPEGVSVTGQVGANARRPVAPRAPRPPQQPGQPQQTVVEAQETVLRIVPDERLNALIVETTEAMMERVRDMIDRLDQPTDHDQNTMHVYELQNADAELVSEALSGITGTTPRQASAGGGGGGAPGGGGGGAPSAEVQPFEKQVVITPYEQTNALLIIAAPQDYKAIRELIAQLDIPQRQVHVEAVIMEVVINDNFALAVETSSLTANDYFALNNVVQLANVISNGPLSVAGAADSPVFLGGILDGTQTIRVPDGAGGFVETEVPKVPLLLTALESITDLDVLSRPSLTSVDNEEASIVIGQEVPFIRGSSRSLDQSAVGASVFSQVDREDVGIKMNVTPQISEGDYVSLELEVEVSQQVQSPVGADPNIVGPTLQKSNVTNKVVIRDGSTGIIGGLISDSVEHSRRQTPLLGDVPGLGWLFRRKNDQRSKRNLVVLVTPHIVKQAHDVERLTDHKMESFRDASVDVLFEKGFINKLKKKHYLRDKHQPSLSNEFLGDPGAVQRFDRGEIRRER